jgi:hypothetical protein
MHNKIKGKLKKKFKKKVLMKIKIMNAATFGAKTKIVTNVQKYKQNI